MRLVRHFVLALAFVASTGAVGFAKCDPSTEPDKSDVANARVWVDANCDCAGATNHGDYLHCAHNFASAMLLNKSCRGTVTKCAARSTCGKPGFQTCCRTARGKTRCSIKSAGNCTPPNNGSACTGSYSSCCDACTAGGCATTSSVTTSSVTTSSVTTTSVTTTSTTLQCSAPGQSCGPCGGFPAQCRYFCGGGGTGTPPLVCVAILSGGPQCTGQNDCFGAGSGYVCVSGNPSCAPGGCEPICH